MPPPGAGSPRTPAKALCPPLSKCCPRGRARQARRVPQRLNRHCRRAVVYRLLFVSSILFSFLSAWVACLESCLSTLLLRPSERFFCDKPCDRSEEHTSELQSLRHL